MCDNVHVNSWEPQCHWSHNFFGGVSIINRPSKDHWSRSSKRHHYIWKSLSLLPLIVRPLRISWSHHSHLIKISTVFYIIPSKFSSPEQLWPLGARMLVVRNRTDCHNCSFWESICDHIIILNKIFLAWAGTWSHCGRIVWISLSSF